MTHYIYDNTALPDEALPLRPVPATADPRQYFTHANFNTLRQALLDIKSAFRGLLWIALDGAQAADPAPSGITRYIYPKAGLPRLKIPSNDLQMFAGVVARASFDGTQDYVDVTWPAITGNVRYGGATAVGAAVVISYSNATSSGVRVNTSARFTGTVDVPVFLVP